MLPQLHEIPLARPALSLIFGILIADALKLTFSPFLLFVSCALVYLTIHFFFSKSVLAPTLLGIGIWVGCALLGATLLHWNRTNINLPAKGKIQGKARIENILKHKKSISTCEISMAAIVNNKHVEYKLNMLYFDSVSFAWKEGDIVYVEGEIAEIKKPLNPFEFDAHGYYFQKGVSGQLIADSLRYLKAIPSWLDNLKKKGRAHIDLAMHSVKDAQVRALLVAMITGDKSDLNQSIKGDFSSAGIMHLLAVSGLHVGLVGWFPLLLLRWCGQRFWLKAVTGIFGLLVVWIFAIFTGLGPSAFRAALMFTLVAIAMFFRFRPSSPNMLCAAAIIVLVSNPTELFSIGFQLSFCAVAGISLGSRVISSIVISRFNWINKLSSAAAVSIAAQGATTPFTLYHFGVFPIYFLPANLIAVPLGTVLMYSILVLLIPDPSGYMHAAVGYIAEHIGLLLLAMASIFANLPFSQIQVTEWGIVNSVLIGVGFLIALTSTKNNPLRLASACLIVIIGLTSNRHYQQENLVFFSDKKRSIGIETNDYALVIGQSKKLPFELQGWATRQQARYIAIVSDTLLICPEVVIAKKGNQQFSNYACVTDQTIETKKYPIAMSARDTSIFPGIRITSEGSQDIWLPSNGAYTISPN
ncbi:MAG: DUF4131 domain-containing protein [Cryomorphaceae bacterium]|nr:DUF4131 domain-containing protein [Cryomorphaceae bacterium]